MAALPPDVKLFAVQAFACYETPLEVRKQIKERWGLEVSTNQLQAYNPATVTGQRLSQKLKDVFTDTRQRFLKDTADIPIAQQSYRLRMMQRLFDRVAQSERPNVAMAQALLEQAAKETGGVFTNKQQHEHAGKDGGPMIVTLKQYTLPPPAPPKADA